MGRQTIPESPTFEARLLRFGEAPNTRNDGLMYVFASQTRTAATHENGQAGCLPRTNGADVDVRVAPLLRYSGSFGL